MRKLKLQVQLTVDGFIEGEKGEMDWMTMNWSDDLKSYVDGLLQPVDTILLGRHLAAGFIPHWEAVANDKENPEREAGIKFTEIHKIVFSKTLTKSLWENTAIENGDFVEAIKALKQQPGSEMIVYGGGKFVSSLIREKLIDELHLFINPAIIGKGMSIFKEAEPSQKLSLLASRQFACGIVVLVYQTG
ncbi:dihydrofolate reductase family protein [Cyclobacterium sp.]|uniref:dihydrofolate reductase family protein n=1 Tax=Cyclobacterium sp. TaxID=1966343 RepID=UPI0019C4F435|nr:dihydrofolate reductase family protein [Cyclobacterium sp.]MBD3627445.1 dihydrofolate reductase family protein [Cyclobacterium sp.]